MRREVVEIVPSRRWHLLLDQEVVGRLETSPRPNGRTFLALDAWTDPDAHDLLDAALAADLGELAVRVDEADHDQLALWTRVGFVPARREAELVIPVPTAVAALAGATLPDGVRTVSADAVDLVTLCTLDEDLRADVPGAEGWVNDLEEFRDQTFGVQFDPALYRVAVDRDGHDLGLVRTWRGRSAPRLGLVAVRRGWRRRGLARALLSEVFAVLDERGVARATAEVDETNLASTTLLDSIGAQVTGTSVELVRPAA